MATFFGLLIPPLYAVLMDVIYYYGVLSALLMLEKSTG
jgi:hypothetical protein